MRVTRALSSAASCGSQPLRLAMAICSGVGVVVMVSPVLVGVECGECVGSGLGVFDDRFDELGESHLEDLCQDWRHVVGVVGDGELQGDGESDAGLFLSCFGE